MVICRFCALARLLFECFSVRRDAGVRSLKAQVAIFRCKLPGSG